MANNKQKISPKLIELSKWKHIDEINRMLDAGESPNAVSSYINKNGFKISTPMVYEYAKLRKQALMDSIDIEHMLGVALKPNKLDIQTRTAASKLKSEIDALDMIIDGGYRTLEEYKDKPINAKTLMDAISLKAKLTNGSHGFLTNYGMEQLRAIEQNKYQIIMDHLISFIPEEHREVAISQIADIEDEYYQGTEYYEEYLKALELPEEEYMRRLELYEQKMNEETTDE